MKRWEERVVSYCITGGINRVELIGADQILLSIALYIYSNASSDQICAFLVVTSGEMYTQQQISNLVCRVGTDMEVFVEGSIQYFLGRQYQETGMVCFSPSTIMCVKSTCEQVNQYRRDGVLPKIVGK